MVALLEDRNGDGVGEMLQPGPAKLKTGEDIEIIIESTGQFTGSLKMRKGGVVSSLKPQDVVADDRVHPMFDSQLLDSRDMGLLALFPDGSNCTADTLDENACPLLKRFYSMIDRHEYFYNTYSALSPDRSNISSQPSPLVACSITLEAAHAWDTAGTPPGGTAGFIFLMRIPFKQILVGSTKNVSTLEPAPEVLSIQSIYNANGDLDMSKVWLDIATLSNNQYESEHEISKFGNVPAEQIEGILVIRKPAAMP
jgi:hypothetical protein